MIDCQSFTNKIKKFTQVGIPTWLFAFVLYIEGGRDVVGSYRWFGTVLREALIGKKIYETSISRTFEGGVRVKH